MPDRPPSEVADNFSKLRNPTSWQRYRIHRARWWKRLRDNIHQVIDGIFSAFLTGYQLPHNSRWSLFAELFWVDCPVCLFWRGVTFGFLLAGFLAMIVIVLILI